MNIQQKRWAMVALSILMSALGNAMVAHSRLGNTYWGIAGENISALTGIEFGTALLILMTLLFIFNRIALKSYRLVLDTLSFVVSIFFSMIINMFLAILSSSIDLTNNFILANIIWFIGLIFMTMAISMYIKLNLIVPAFDETMGVFAKLYFKGNFVKAGYLAMTIAMIITVVVGLINNRTFIGFNLHSLFILLTFSYFIQFFMDNMKFYDKFIEFGEFEKSVEIDSNPEVETTM